MASVSEWLFVDDNEVAARSFAAKLSQSDRFIITPVLPQKARDLLLSGRADPDGVLMDIDLSEVPGENGTGLGLAQDIRAKQKSGVVREFPIVRFARREPVARNVGGDPASDDLFDLKIEKEKVKVEDFDVVSRLQGVQEVYEKLAEVPKLTDEVVERFLGLDRDHLDAWSHPDFHDRLASGRQVAVHVAAGLFLRAFILVSGLLIDEDLLSVRLGVDKNRSGSAWSKLLEKLEPFRYKGVSCAAFPRWWAHGLNNWWLDLSPESSPLSALTIDERMEEVKHKLGIHGIEPLIMPEISPGSKPWRLCALSLENDHPLMVPIDPESSVRMTQHIDFPVWVDPAYAALGPALRARDDRRLNQGDLLRLQRIYR